MKVFGEKNRFAIEYELISTNSCSSYGYINLWINNMNICSYNQDQQYEGELYYIADWFCDKIEYVLGYDAFPLPVKGNTAQELIENADHFESDNNLEFDLWHTAKSRWLFNHCWFGARGGSVFPCVYFRRVGEYIEISWDNEFWKESDIVFDSQKGAYRVEFEIFSKIITKFLFSIIDDLEKISNKSIIKKLRTQINILKE